MTTPEAQAPTVRCEACGKEEPASIVESTVPSGPVAERVHWSTPPAGWSVGATVVFRSHSGVLPVLVYRCADCKPR